VGGSPVPIAHDEEVTGFLDVGRLLIANLRVSIADVHVWQAIGVSIVTATVLFLVGVAISRRMGLLAPDRSDWATVGVGLSTGLIVCTAVAAAIFSFGRSGFTPVAIGLVASVIFHQRLAGPWNSARSLQVPIGLRSAGFAMSFLTVTGLLYAATMAPSPRDGFQPVEFMDEAFYSILARDVVDTGRETYITPSGFADLAGVPPQLWYHWGEIWLTGIVDAASGIGPLFARHLVVLPILVLSAATLMGALAASRLRSRPRPRWPPLIGAACCLALAPLPLPITYFSSWSTGQLFAVTTYGLGLVIVALVLFLLVSRPIRSPRTTQVAFVGSAVASLLPAHILIALLGVGGAVAGSAIQAASARRSTGAWPRPTSSAVRFVLAGALAAATTFAWGTATGHGLWSPGAASEVRPFNADWAASLAATLLVSLAFVCIPIAWWRTRATDPVFAGTLAGTMAIVTAGALVWGSRVGDLNMFHLYFGGIAAYAIPAAAASIVVVAQRVSRPWRVVLTVVLAFQLEAGAGTSLVKLQGFGPRDYAPIPTSILTAIEATEPDSKIAYQCRPLEEIAIWDPRLASIDAHTGRRVVPLCFQANIAGGMTGGTSDPEAMGPTFLVAPQRELFPEASARPSPQQLRAFLQQHGVDYLLVDPVHPDELMLGGTPIAQGGVYTLFRLPPATPTESPQ
jgi:hypothetical protein